MVLNFKIINNLSKDDNHLSCFKKLFEASDTVILISPFLVSDFSDFFNEIDFSLLKKFHLITTLKPKSYDQIKKVNSLSSLIDIPKIKDKSVSCRISLNNKLHGKIYIFKKNNMYLSAIISSANFTNSGLSRNHEWGVEIFDHEEIKSLEDSVIENEQNLDLSFDEINRMIEAVDKFLDNQPQIEERDIDLNLINLISSSTWIAELDNRINYWLKPIGVTGEPVEEGRLFNKIIDNLHFSKTRPTGVKPNDILIAYGVGTGKILSVYKSNDFPERVSNEDIAEENWFERWPWYIKAQNLTTQFGSNWWKHDIFLNELKNQFLELNKEGSITLVGGKTLGALNYSADKFRLSPEFAKFIINKVVAINDRY